MFDQMLYPERETPVSDKNKLSKDRRSQRGKRFGKILRDESSWEKYTTVAE